MHSEEKRQNKILQLRTQALVGKKNLGRLRNLTSDVLTYSYSAGKKESGDNRSIMENGGHRRNEHFEKRDKGRAQTKKRVI